MTLECCHFTVQVCWGWNVTSQWICGDAGMLSLHF